MKKFLMILTCCVAILSINAANYCTLPNSNDTISAGQATFEGNTVYVTLYNDSPNIRANVTVTVEAGCATTSSRYEKTVSTVVQVPPSGSATATIVFPGEVTSVKDVTVSSPKCVSE